MDFPARPSVSVPTPPGVADALGVAPIEVVADAFNYLTLLESAQAVRDLSPEITAIASMDRGGVIVTAMGDGVHDFVSRYFAPATGIPEDLVTGGAHCALTPYWSKRLNKTAFRTYQASPRGGGDQLPAGR
jgi:predicted PhzF superfamily epimerase YddE/YHI9